jgi:hypothetical protein
MRLIKSLDGHGATAITVLLTILFQGKILLPCVIHIRESEQILHAER